jgi:hypothetical protein
MSAQEFDYEPTVDAIQRTTCRLRTTGGRGESHQNEASEIELYISGCPADWPGSSAHALGI